MKKLVYASLCVMLFASIAIAATSDAEWRTTAGIYTNTRTSTSLVAFSSGTYRVAYIVFCSTYIVPTTLSDLITVTSSATVIGYTTTSSIGTEAVLDFRKVGGVIVNSINIVGSSAGTNTSRFYTIVYKKIYW